MSRCKLIFAVAALLLPHIAWAQAHQPYAGMEARGIKALSDQQIADLKAGRGMGLALAAELNGYPGPVHVLELADRLELSAAQRQRVDELFHAMKAETTTLGETLIAAEANLDRQFAIRTITQAALADAVRNAALAQGNLRAAHLKYHLVAIEVLTPEQVKRYSELRGYGKSSAPHQH
jgi:Spy/CpxP family protein refolding chaperone